MQEITKSKFEIIKIRIWLKRFKKNKKNLWELTPGRPAHRHPPPPRSAGIVRGSEGVTILYIL